MSNFPEWLTRQVDLDQYAISRRTRSNVIFEPRDVWLDCEFIDDGDHVDLISIGMVSGDGREYYAQSAEFEPKDASPWVKENVLSHLTICPSYYHNPFLTQKPFYDDLIVDWAFHNTTKGQCRTGGADPLCLWRSRKQIRDEIAAFLDPAKYGKPRLHMWCGTYDHLALCQLFGPMMALPDGFPHHFYEFQCILDERDISDEELPQQEAGLHNALEDARHLKKLWGHVMRKPDLSGTQFENEYYGKFVE